MSIGRLRFPPIAAAVAALGLLLTLASVSARAQTTETAAAKAPRPATAPPAGGGPGAAPAPATVPPAAATPPAAPRQITKLVVEDEVQGTCETPRETILQLLYWIQEEKDRVDYVKAAACMDGSALTTPNELPDRARMLKKTLDLRGLYIDPDALPRNPSYRNDNGVHRYRLPALPEAEIVKVGDKWLISAATVHATPALYHAMIPELLDGLLLRLPDSLRGTVLGVAVWQILGLLLLAFVALTLQKITVYFIQTYVQRLTGKLRAAWVQKTTQHVDRPIGGLVLAGVFYLGFPWLQFAVRINQIARIAASVLAAYSLVWLAYRMIDVLTDWLAEKADATDTKLDDQLVPLVRKTLKVFVAVIGGIFILQNLNVDVASLLAGLGLGGLAFALAAKDSIANIFGSFVIFIDKPFQIGDWVVIANTEGTVEEVGFRTTRIRTFYNSLVTVPNAQMTNVAIDNYGARRFRRYKATVGVTYDTPPQKVQAFCEGIRAIIQQLPGMRKDFYLVELQGFGDSSLNILLYTFMDVPDWATELRTRTNLNLEIMRLAQSLGVSFAFPTRTLHVDTLAQQSEIPGQRELSDSDLTSAVKAYGPGGADAMAHGYALTHGFDPGSPPPSNKGSDRDDSTATNDV